MDDKWFIDNLHDEDPEDKNKKKWGATDAERASQPDRHRPTTSAISKTNPARVPRPTEARLNPNPG